MNNFVILIPSYNDWDSLNVLIPKIHNVIKDLNKNISIIIINDSSTIKKRLIFKDKLCFNKIEILNLLENIKAQKAIATALYYLKKYQHGRLSHRRLKRYWSGSLIRWIRWIRWRGGIRWIININEIIIDLRIENT